MLQALARLEEGVRIEEHPGVPAWVFGAIALVALLLALFLVTRFNPDR